METEVIMQRELFGSTIGQKSKSGFLCATDLERAGNAWRASQKMGLFEMSSWLMQKNVKEFKAALEEKYGQVLISGKGRGNKTWMHPYLFIDMALAISPDLKVEVYAWIYDHLIQYRNDSGDSYKRMAGALYSSHPNKTKFPYFISTTAEIIRKEVGVDDWQAATEQQLKLRDKIHDNIALLADILPCDDAVRVGIKKAKDGK